MCRRRTVAAEADPSAPRLAREFASDLLRRWELTDPDGSVMLLVSELVTNAVLHARTPLEVTLSVADGCVEVAVRDHDRRPPIPRSQRADLVADLQSLLSKGPVPAQADEDSRHPSLHVGDAGSVLAGRGLILVDALSDEWGVSEASDGKTVWARVAVDHGWPYRKDCPCPTGVGVDPSLLPSGRPVVSLTGPWDEEPVR